MNFYLINFRDDDDDRLRGVMRVRAETTDEACIWARTMMVPGQHAVIWDSDDNMLCTVGETLNDLAVH